MQNIKNLTCKHSSIFCFISGLLLTCSFSFKQFWWLSFFSLVPLFLVILNGDFDFKKLIKYNLFFTLGYYVPLIYWLYNIRVLLPTTEPVSSIMIIISILFIGMVQGFYLIVATIVFPAIKTGKLVDIFTFSALYILSEFIQEYTIFAPFPWTKLGVMVAPFTAFIQSASLFGVYFISALVLIINGCIAFILLNYKTKKIKPAIIFLLAIFVVNTTFGTIKISFSDRETNFDAVAVQGNFSGLNKWKSPTAEMFEQYCTLTRQSVTEKTKLVVWPETAINTRIDGESDYKTKLLALSKELNVVIVSGHFTYQQDGNAYNTTTAFSPDGTISQPYHKQILVPFGEYFPLGDVFKSFLPVFTEIIQSSSSVLRGEDYQLLDSTAGKLGSIICYESIFSDIARNNSRLGAELFILPSNDSWFGKSSALYQHNNQAILRCVENNRYLVRASNTGITSIISQNGEIIAQAQTHITTALVGSVALISKRTLYSYIGNSIMLFSGGVFILGTFSIIRKKIKIKRH